MIWLYWILGLSASVILSILIVRKDRESGYLFMTVLASAYVLISNILTPRLMNLNLFGYKAELVTGSLIWPFIGQISDMINEVYGKKKTLTAFAIAYFTNLLLVVFVAMAENTVPVWSSQEEAFWLKYFTPSSRVFVASSISFIICQFLDASCFSFLKERSRSSESSNEIKKLVWLSSVRSVMSDVTNMIFDALIFSIMAFWGLVPTSELLAIIAGSLIIKTILSVIDTPLFALYRIGIKNVKRNK